MSRAPLAILLALTLAASGCWDLDRLAHLYEDASVGSGDLMPPDAGCAGCDAAPSLHDAGCAGCDAAPSSHDANCVSCNGQCVEVENDVKHCGSCDHDCTALPGVRAEAVECHGGVCILNDACMTDRADCNAASNDGCETDLTAAANCGGCAKACPTNAPQCAASASGWACLGSCGGATPDLCGTTCTRLATDPLHCGSCAPCPLVANASPTCTNGVCGHACNPGFHDCAGQCVSNSSPASCGGSCESCSAPINGTPTCDGAACGFTCALGYQRVGATCQLAAHLVFVTSEDYTSNLGGLSGADALCQSRASAAGLPGTFKAWLSTSSTSASSRLNHSSVPYILVDGSVVAAGWTDLTDGALQHAINLDEFGVGPTPAGTRAWTGSYHNGATFNGTFGYPETCNDWTSSSVNNDGMVGSAQQTDKLWSTLDMLATPCSPTHRYHLYCFQQ